MIGDEDRIHVDQCQSIAGARHGDAKAGASRVGHDSSEDSVPRDTHATTGEKTHGVELGIAEVGIDAARLIASSGDDDIIELDSIENISAWSKVGKKL